MTDAPVTAPVPAASAWAAMPDAPTGMAALAATYEATDWAKMRDRERGEEIPRMFNAFRRRTAIEAWNIGRALRAHCDVRTGHDWREYLREIDMPRDTARRLVKLADLTAAQIAQHGTVDAALKALKPAPEPAPAPVVEPAPDDPPAVTPEVVTDDDGGHTAAAVVAAEAAPDPVALREERLERLALRTEDIDGDVVEAWADKLDKADARHREDVATINTERRKTAAAERQLRDMTDALLSEPGCPCCDGVLATFRGVARKGAA